MVVNSGLSGLLEFCLTWWYLEVFLQVFSPSLVLSNGSELLPYTETRCCHSFQLLLDWLVRSEMFTTHTTLRDSEQTCRQFYPLHIVTFLSPAQYHECILYNFIMG